MQSLIRSEFVACTVLCVEHHLENILDYNKIDVFDEGLLVGFDAPDVLMHTESRYKQLLSMQS